MKPVLSVAAMREADAAAQMTTPVPVLMERAGAHLARGVLRALGGAYGRRVAVVAGRGNNGGDGRVAARRLELAGARVRVVDAAAPAGEIAAALGGADAVVDAAYGTGFRGVYEAPAAPEGCPVVACDIPSGIDGDTGVASGSPPRAVATVTFAALKPGLLFADGPVCAGAVTVAGIGIDVGAGRAAVPGAGPRVALVEDGDVERLFLPRERDTHKWRAAVTVVAGSPGMAGAAGLCARAALRAGSGMVRLALPGTAPDDADGAVLAAAVDAGDAVIVALAGSGWETGALEAAQRSRVIVAGPGLGRGAPAAASVRRLVVSAPVAMVLDADAVVALGPVDDAARLLGERRRTIGAPVVLTPHDGELAALTGAPPGPDRIGTVAGLARRLGAVVLLKGPTTVVAGPDGDVVLAAAGSPRLATPGTGDVLAGLIGAFLARGVQSAATAAALGAHVHGRAAALGFEEGLVASDLPELVARWLSGMRAAARDRAAGSGGRAR